MCLTCSAGEEERHTVNVLDLFLFNQNHFWWTYIRDSGSAYCRRGLLLLERILRFIMGTLCLYIVYNIYYT